MCWTDRAGTGKSFRKDLQNPAKDFASALLPGYGCAMTARPIKHSLTLHGHRTSVSLETAFWEAFCDIAKAKNVAVNALAAEIDAARAGDEGLASAIRVFVLRHHQAR